MENTVYSPTRSLTIFFSLLQMKSSHTFKDFKKLLCIFSVPGRPNVLFTNKKYNSWLILPECLHCVGHTPYAL